MSTDDYRQFERELRWFSSPGCSSESDGPPKPDAPRDRTPATTPLAVGDRAPTFSLADTVGIRHAPASAPATVILFTCNECPHARAWHDRLMGVAHDYVPRGVHFLASNASAAGDPREGLEAMKTRVASERWPIPYLHDPGQEVARAFGARMTPELFVIDASGHLRYRGAPDSDHRDPGKHAMWLREALDAILDGRPVSVTDTPAAGSPVKWR